MLEGLLPTGVSPAFAILIVAVSAGTSALTGAFGLGGGVALLGVMAQGLPVATLIPVHGIAQLGSNFGRALVQHRHVDWHAAISFSVGGLIGALAGAPMVTALPEAMLKSSLALFILWAVFGRKPQLSGKASDRFLVFGGLTSSFASMFFGATGPVTMAFLAARGLAKHALIATHATAMVFQHGIKIAAFGGLGFSLEREIKGDRHPNDEGPEEGKYGQGPHHRSPEKRGWQAEPPDRGSCAAMLPASAHIQEFEVEQLNRRRARGPVIDL